MESFQRGKVLPYSNLYRPIIQDWGYEICRHPHNFPRCKRAGSEYAVLLAGECHLPFYGKFMVVDRTFHYHGFNESLVLALLIFFALKYPACGKLDKA